MKKLNVVVLFMLIFTGMAYAHEYKIGSLEVDHPYMRETPPGAAVAGGFMTIHNHGDTADRLIGGEVDFAGHVEVHTMSMEDGIMKMMKLENGLEIPAKGEAVLKPGGYHIMFINLDEQVKQGKKYEGVLIFEKAGKVEVEFSVEKVKTMDHDHGHQH